MKEVSQSTVCIVDHGLYFSLALELAKSFKRVLYQNACWIDGFPTLNKCIIGDGHYPEVQAIDDYWPLKNDIDVFVFPDIYHSGEQLELESQDKAVWGSRNGDKLEIYRQRFLKVLGEVGLEVPRFSPVEGLTNLRLFLKDKEDQYIKISRYRGSLETSHWRNQAMDSHLLDQWAVKFGPAQELITFLVFEAIETDIEIGCDTYCIDGQFPNMMVEGIEWKDKGYFGTVHEASEMPEQLRAVNTAFAQELKDVRYRNLISSEVRIKGDKFYFIDPTRRFPCPASGSQMKLYGNLAEIINAGAHGELVQPEMTGKYAVEVVICGKGNKTNWDCVEFPKELSDSIMCGNCCDIDGMTCWPPSEHGGDEIAWLVNVGDTPEETINGVLEKAKLIPDGVSAKTEALADILKELQTAEDEGVIEPEHEIPEPAVALD